MEGRGRSRARKKRFFSPKRLTSFLLAAAMVFTNVGADLSTAFAADSTDVSFEMRGADLVAAIEDAVASENVVAPDDLNFTNGNVEKFEDFLFGDGKLYEAYPEMDGGDVETELRVFVRLPESADDMYAVTGDEEVIFLYVNNSDETVRFRSYISYTKDGEEEIKRTDSVTVRSYESAYGDEEVNVISDPVEVPETEESTEAPETAAPETEVPAEEPETEIPADETVTAPEEETPAEETAGEEDPVATESEMKVSFSRNEAALVAAPAGDDPKATPSEMEDSKDPEESNEGLVDEGNMPNEKDPADVPGESAPAEESTPADETTVTGEPQVPETTAPEPQVPETTAPETTPAATPSETVPEKKPDAPKPSYSDLVGIGWSGTAKMYTSTLNKLHAFEDVDGWQIQYSIDPEGSARIVDGPRGVEDGEDLYFGVKNQLGYAVETVLANGEELAADTITDNEDGSQAAWYTVYGVTEEQNIDVVMAETGEHPGFSQEIQMDDGMVITIQADEGVLPDGVTATAARAGEDVENAVAEQATEDGKAITSVKAYDISLWLDGQLLDSAIWGGSRKVEVTFSGAAVEEQSAQANTLEIVHVETAQAAQPRMRLMTAAAPAASVTGIDQVKAVEVPEGQTVSAISFEAEHFSIYAVVGGVKYEDRYTMQVGETITLRADDVYAFDGGYWTSSDRSVVEITRQEGSLWNPYADVKAKKASSESVRITYHYGVFDWQQQTFKISVKQADTATAYFYILRPDGNAGSLEDEDWLYVGTGTIKTDNLRNQYGGPLQENKGQYDLAVEGKVTSYPNDQRIKEQIARLYNADIEDVEISYEPFKISYPMGYVDEKGNSHLGNTPCYHVDMTVSITTKEQASVTFLLQDAGETGYKPVEGTYTVKLGTEVHPRENYPDTKSVDGIEYEFSGWYTNSDLESEPVEFPYRVTEAVKFYAKYEPKEMVTILYQAVGGKVTNDRETFAADAGRDAAKGSQAVKTDGYVFKGWYDNDKGTGQPLGTGYDIFKPKKPQTGWANDVYYAVFEKIEESEIDGPYVEIDDVDNDKEYYQGSVNVEVYLDGEKVEENSETIYYGYEQYNCVDLELTYPENEKVVLNAIYAKQSYGEDGYEEITSELVDNVENGSTVYIYLSSVYTVEYTAENAENVEQDNKKYTLPEYPRRKHDYSRYVNGELKDYETKYIEVKSLPEKEQYTFDGWFDKDSQKVTPNSRWALQDAVAKADDKNIIKLNATSKLTGYKIQIQHIFLDKDGEIDKKIIQPWLGSGDSYKTAGELVKIDLQKEEGYMYSGKTEIITDDKDYENKVISDQFDSPISFEMPAGTTVAKVYYETDVNEDKVPDKYQVTVTYVAEGNGAVSKDGAAEKKEIVTLYKYGEPAEGWALPTDPTAKGRTTGDGIYATPKEGYSFVNWTYPITDSENGVISTAAPGVIEVTGDLTVTAHFEETKYDLIVNYWDEAGKQVIPGLHEGNYFEEGEVYRLYDVVHKELTGKDGNHYVRIIPDDTVLAGIAEEGDANFKDGAIVINAIYALDNLGGTEEKPGDGIPDKYQVTVAYVSDDYGYVTEDDRPLMTEVVTLYKHGEPAEGWALPTDPTAKGRTTGDGIYATPKEGYSFVNWTYPIIDSENGVISTAAPGVIEVTGDLTVTAHFEETKYELFVEHVYYDADGNKVEEIWEKDTKQLAGGTPIEEELQEKTGYVFESIDTDRTDGQELEYNFDGEKGVFISSMPDTTTYVQFNYVADANGDQIPDKYQDTIVFVAVNGTFDENGTTQLDKVITYTNDGTAAGKLDAEGKYTLTAEDIPAATAAEGYAQDSLKWDDPAPLGYTIFSTVDAENNPSKKVFIVRFEPEEAETQTYTIHHLEEGTDKVLAEDVVETAAVGSVIDGKDKQLSINGYAFVSATTLEVKADSEQNHVYVYYGKDSIGPDGDNDPDGEPDAYQIVFTFRSSDEAKGTLSGTTRQVYTFKDNDGNYVKPAEGISQRAVQQYLEGTMEGFEAVTITSKEGYEFDYWTVENQEVAPDYTSTMDELGNTPFTQDTTFVVYFSSVGGSSENPGGDSGSGGNSGGGGGGSSSGPSGSGGSSTAGPGVTITDGDVPLAPLPSDGSGSSAVIYDDNVPLAPLPKTGQESLKAPLTALFAGIFLALASLKRRKEEN